MDYYFDILFKLIFIFSFVDSDAEPLSSKAKKPARKFGNPSAANTSPGLSKRRGGGLGEGNGAQTDGDYHIAEMKQGANNIMVSATNFDFLLIFILKRIRWQFVCAQCGRKSLRGTKSASSKFLTETSLSSETQLM